MAVLPIHPLTGVQAIGFTRRGPIWPVMGGAPDDGGNGGNGGTDGAGGNGSGAGNESTGAGASNASAGGGQGGGAEKTLSQNDVDRIVQGRLAQERDQINKKYGNLDDLLAAKTKLEEHENKGKPEADQLRSKLTRAETRAAEAESARTASDLRLLKFEVASQVEGFPISAVSRLQGTTADEIKADAEKFLTEFGGAGQQQQQNGPRPPRPNQYQGHSSDAGAATGAALGRAEAQRRFGTTKT